MNINDILDRKSLDHYDAFYPGKTFIAVTDKRNNRKTMLCHATSITGETIISEAYWRDDTDMLANGLAKDVDRKLAKRQLTKAGYIVDFTPSETAIGGNRAKRRQK